jgi:hypothetical protein
MIVRFQFLTWLLIKRLLILTNGFDIEVSRQSYRIRSFLLVMHMWLLKVNFERVLIVLLSESIRTTWFGYSIDSYYYLNDRYLNACIRNGNIFFFCNDNDDGNFSFIFRSVYTVTFHGNFLFFFICWPL